MRLIHLTFIKYRHKSFVILFSIVIFISISIQSLSQKVVLKGFVYDNYNKALANARISIPKNKQFIFDDTTSNVSYTDINGYFNIKCKIGDAIYVNYNNQLVNDATVLSDTISIYLHIPRVLAWDGYAYDSKHNFIFSVIYLSNFNYSIDYLYSLSHNKKIKQIFDFGIRYLNMKNSLNEQLLYLYLNIRSPYYDNFVIKYLNPYIETGNYWNIESKKTNQRNFGFGIGLTTRKKYIGWFNVQFNLSSHYLQNDINNYNFSLGLKIGLTKARMVGGDEYY